MQEKQQTFDESPSQHDHLAQVVARPLKEQQSSLQQFMQEWCSRQEQILQSIAIPSGNANNAIQPHGGMPCISESTPCNALPALDSSESNSEVRNGFHLCTKTRESSETSNHSKPDTTRYRRQFLASFPNMGSSYGDLLSAVRGTTVEESCHPAADQLTSLQSVMQAMFPERQSHKPVDSRPQMMQLVTSRWFEAFSIVCIMSNAAVIAYAADRAAENLNSPDDPVVVLLEKIFTMLYIIELAIRCLAHRWAFFRTSDWAWNLFDAVLVLSAIYNQVIEMATSQTVNSVVFLRVIRMMKMLKLLRMVRIMRMFKELRLIVKSIKGSVKSMIWAIFLIVIITYIVGLCFLQAVTNYLNENVDRMAENEVAEMRVYWGSLSKAMLSLYMASTNGDSWKTMADALLPAGALYYMFFLLYIAFFMFVVMNTLTSLFIEATMQNAEKDKYMMIHEEMQKKNDYVRRAIQLFEHMDEDGSGEVSEQEFKKHATNPEMMAFASSLELDVLDIAEFYNMLSCHGKFQVDAETFVVGCLKLKGTARSLDLQGLIVSQKRALRALEFLVENSNRSLALVHEALICQAATSKTSDCDVALESPPAPVT